MAVVIPSEESAGIFVSQSVASSDGAALLRTCGQAGLPGHLVVHDRTRPPSPAELASIRIALLSVDVIGLSSKTKLEPELATFVDTLYAAPNLQWLQVCSAGMDRPFYAELHSRGVRLTSAAGANAKAVAQTAVAGLLALSRCIPMWIEAQGKRQWKPMRGALIPPQLEGQHAVVVGMGGIGLDIGRVLKALELRVTGVRRSPSTQPYFDRVVGFNELDSVLPDADWLVLACPLTEQTRHLIDGRRLKLMRQEARIVNVARGEVIDEAALIEALRNQAVAGAYLDVFEKEPLPPESPLWDLPGVLISAHSAGNSTGHQRGVINQFTENLIRFANKSALHNEWQGAAAAQS
jgi:D-2-hydroxyacid dehydrogenase (NADP+)